jgi:hypothetical protein
MANEDFKKILIQNVELKYPRLNETYRFNTAKRQSEPCAPTASGASWSIAWTMSAEQGNALYKELKAHYLARQAAGGIKAEFTGIFGMKKLEDGTVEVRAKRNGTKASGEVNMPPIVIGGDKQPLADKGIWSGSKGNVRCFACPVTDPEGKAGVSLFLDALQVTHAVYGGGGLDDFADVGPTKQAGAVDDPFAADAPEDDPFATPAPKPTPAKADYDDEIPF